MYDIYIYIYKQSLHSIEVGKYNLIKLSSFGNSLEMLNKCSSPVCIIDQDLEFVDVFFGK